MVKPPTFDSNGMKKGAWSKEEDDRLKAFVHEFGHTNWRLLPLLAGLARCGKSCRLRWVNYLKPGLKRGKFTKHEEELIIKLHQQLGNKWSAIAVKIPGRTDNEIKNYWHAHIKKRGRRGGIRAPILHKEEGSSPSSSSSSSDHQEGLSAYQNPKTTDDLNPIADFYSFARANGDDVLSAHDLSHQITCISQMNGDLPPFPVEEFYDFELFPEMQNDSSNSSDGGSSFCSLTSAEFRGNFCSESFGEDNLEILDLW
ncbi:hypothetical protein C2S52_011829 [Perilla frutescens var. hirtella]|nr:hypothetical protein C2S52_011829 [Perilla frutescens var. hirtella]